MSTENSTLLPTAVDEVSQPERKTRWNFVLPVALSSLAIISMFLIFQHTPSILAKTYQVSNLASDSSETESVVMYSSMSDTEKASMFEDFKTKFERSYQSDDEEADSYENFVAFLKLVDDRNADEVANGGSPVHGITMFADMSLHEFKKNYLGYKASDTENLLLESKVATVTGYSGSEKVVNWAGVLTTPVKNQGYCGSCWAFSATEQVESDGIRAGLLTTSSRLSAQQIVSCDNHMYGCDGGYPSAAYDYVSRSGGLLHESDYKYTSADGDSGTCEITNKADFKITVSEYYTLDSEADMKSYMLSTGPMSVCVSAEVWGSYESGVLSSCGNLPIDHCVQAVGINTEASTPYWIVRNSWTTNWGESGYIYVKEGSNTCKISDMATYTTVSATS